MGINALWLNIRSAFSKRIGMLKNETRKSLDCLTQSLIPEQYYPTGDPGLYNAVPTNANLHNAVFRSANPPAADLYESDGCRSIMRITEHPI